MEDEAIAQMVMERVEKLLGDYPPATTDKVTFLRAQYDAGLAWVHFPAGSGGLGVAPELQDLIDSRLNEASAPPSGRVSNPIAAGQGAATVVAFGSDDQRRRYLRPLFTTELTGCQLYSEPGSGSDLASLATRAVRDGDDWVVNGQKVWTSGAHRAQWAILLARTDPHAVKHAGLTQFVLDMTDPGVTVRPLRQMSGGAEFNEVFLEDVHIPDSERLGGVGEGWAVSQHTLVHERHNMPRVPRRGEGAIAPVVEAWHARVDKTSPAALALKNELMEHWVDAEVLRLLQLRAVVARAQGKTGAEGSLGKLAFSVLLRRLSEWAPALLGAEGMLIDSYDAPDHFGVAVDPGSEFQPRHPIQKACVQGPGLAIAGGTDEIQRNIIGDRVLGLPREPDPAKGLAWSKTLRN